MNRSERSSTVRTPRATQVASVEDAREMNVSRNLSLLRMAAQELGYTIDALAAVMPLARGYIGNVMSGGKPLRSEFELSLPTDLQIEYRKRQAESLGLIVVAPASSDDAVRALVSGLVGVLTSRPLPTHAERMVKAQLAPAAAKVSA